MTGASPAPFSRSMIETSPSPSGDLDGLGVELSDDVVEIDLLLVVLDDRFVDRGFARDRDRDVEAGAELEIVDRVDVRRIGHGHDERRAGAVHRNELMAFRELRGNERDDVGADLPLAQVDRRDGVLLRQEGGELLLLDDAELGEAVTETRARLLLIFLGFLQLLERDQIFANEKLTQSGHARLRVIKERLDESVEMQGQFRVAPSDRNRQSTLARGRGRPYVSGCRNGRRSAC